MNLIKSPWLVTGASALSLLSACSRTSQTSTSSQAVSSPQIDDSTQTAPLSQTVTKPGSSHSSADLDCPVSSIQQVGGILNETPSRTSGIGRRLGLGGKKEIAAAIAQLRSRHPKASEGEIVNFLITAHCPMINAKSGMSLSEKQQALRSFATEARKLAGPG